MNKLFRIKVCGLTRPSDASLAARLGADMIGLIFHRPSPRYVSGALAKQIIQVIPKTVMRVGVFVDPSVDYVLRAANRLSLDCVQLHGGESPAMVRQIQREGYRVIKAFSVNSRGDFSRLAKSPADFVLVDNATADSSGGTGRQFDWSLKPSQRIGHLVLAGGISADNVEEGVARFRPLMVDVNSGVESRPGVKSPAKLRKFFAECNRIRYGR